MRAAEIFFGIGGAVLLVVVIVVLSVIMAAECQTAFERGVCAEIDGETHCIRAPQGTQGGEHE